MTGVGHAPGFHCEVQRTDKGTVVAAIGELDMGTVEIFDATLRAVLEDGPAILDLARLSFMDSSGVRALDGIVRDGRDAGWQLVIRPELQRAIEHVFQLTGVLGALPIEARTREP